MTVVWSLDLFSGNAPSTWSLCVLTCFVGPLIVFLVHRHMFARSIRYALSRVVQKLPFVGLYIKSLQQKIVSEFEVELEKKKGTGRKSHNRQRVCLPVKGYQPGEVINRCRAMQAADSAHTSQMSGAIYVPPQSEAFKMCSQVYSMFAHTNPLHGDAFPSICQMESDIVSMVSVLLGAQTGDDICGNVTSGGTESILSAIRTSRDYICSKRQIRQPEMIVSTSAHAAVYKAAEYFCIKLVLIGNDGQGRMDLAQLRAKMNQRVILVYASAPGYPHGVIDPIRDIARYVKEWGCCLHVDACLGGFVLPFADSEVLGSAAYPEFDFQIPEVTSMSIDTHKYGCAQKGSSVVLYRSREIRKFQYTAVSSWTGGMYISPTQAGSRSGGIIAQTWAAMMHFGSDGYEQAARQILLAAQKLRCALRDIFPLEVVGKDLTMVVAWRSLSKSFDIYVLNDVLAEMGWHLSVLHSPPALHLCITSANVGTIDLFVTDLRKAVDRVQKGDIVTSGAKAPIYGMGNRMSNTTVVDDLLKDIQDVLDTT